MQQGDFPESTPSGNSTLILLHLASLEPLVRFPTTDPAWAHGQPEPWVFVPFAALTGHSASTTVSGSCGCFLTLILDLTFGPGVCHLSRPVPNGPFCQMTVVLEKSSYL